MRYKYYLPFDDGVASSCRAAYDACMKEGYIMPSYHKFQYDLKVTGTYHFNSLSNVYKIQDLHPSYFI